jgi:four helix bundle protein
MSERSEQLKQRTMAFAITVLRLIERLPQTASGQTIARQLAKSATSVGANYRAACNARSRAEFISKLCIVVEEADESVYWLDLIARTEAIIVPDSASARQEAVELRAIFSRSVGTARLNQRQRKG